MSTASLVDLVSREIGRYVSGELDDWLNARTLNLPHDDAAFPLPREVFLFFAEVSSGHRTEEDVREALRGVTVEPRAPANPSGVAR